MAEPLPSSSLDVFMPNASVAALQAALDVEVRKLDAPRMGQLFLDVCICTQYDCPTSYESANVCQLMDSLKHSNAHFYLHPKYTLVKKEGASLEGQAAFVVDESEENTRRAVANSIKRAAILGGDRLSLGSEYGKKSKDGTNGRCFNLICQCARVYKGKKVGSISGNIINRDDYRKTSITNDKKNRRKGPKGRASSHRTDTVRRFSINEHRCGFRISVFRNGWGYYIKPKPGEGKHQYHDVRSKLRMPSNLLVDDDTAIMKDLNSAKALTGVAVNAHYVRSSRKGTPTLLSKDQVRYICKGKKKSTNNDKESSALDGSDMDDLFEYLETSGSSYVALIQEVKTDDNVESSSIKKVALFNETRIEDTVTKDNYEILTSEDANAKDITDSFRQSRKIRDDQEMVVGVAYVTPFESRQFQLFHCVLQVDATADTNNEGRPLVTGTSKDSEGKMFTVFRAFLPNQQAWAFKWLFQVVCPALLGKETLNDVSIILTDGDPQQITQLEDAIALHFPNTYRGRCSWHIIDRGWSSMVQLAMGGHTGRKRPLRLKGTKRKKPSPLSESNKIARKLYRWIFSWAQADYCDSREEFEVSKALFVRFVNSSQVTEVIGTGMVDKILDFLRQHVSQHEYRFCYYVRRALFHLETHSNTSHEGTNNGMKNCAAPVMPQNSVESAVETLSFNAHLKTEDTLIRLSQKRASKKLWSSSPTADNITDLGEGLLDMEWEKGTVWKAVRAPDIRWLTYHQNEEEAMNETIDAFWENEFLHGEEIDATGGQENETTPSSDTAVSKLKRFGHIPKFNRVFVVTIDENCCLVCTCAKHPRMGYCCRHIAAVMMMEPLLLNAYPNGFPLSSVKVFWRQEHYVYGMSTDPTHNRIKASLSALSKQDTTGVPCPRILPNSWDTTVVPEHLTALLHTPAECRVLNYSNAICSEALRELKDRENAERLGNMADVPIGFSQTSHFGDGNEEDEAFSFIINEPSQGPKDGRCSDRLKSTFYDAAEAIHNSDRPEELEQKLLDVLNDIIGEATKNCSSNVEQNGKRLSMLPPSSQRQKTHGTAHMH